MTRKPPPVVIPRGKLMPHQRAPIIPTRVVQDKRRKVGRKAKHKKQPSGVGRQPSGESHNGE